MRKKVQIGSVAEKILGILLYAFPVVCALFIVVWAGRAYTEGYGLFVQKALDDPGDAHSEMVTITEEDAGSAMAVGKILEREDLISSSLAFAVKARLSGCSGALIPGTYILSSDMTMEQMLQRLSAGTTEAPSGQDGSTGETPAAGELQESIPSDSKENRDVWGQ